MKDDDKKDEPSAAEVAEQEKKDAIARGDVVDDEELAKAAAEADDNDDEEKTAEEIEAEAAAIAAAEEEEEEGDEPGASTDDDINIPKARYDETRKAARIKEAALEARIAELEKGSAKDAPTIKELQAEIEELEDKHEAHLLEGEIVEAKALRREMNAKRDALLDRRISEKSSAMGAAAVEQVRYDNQLAAFEAKYPAMNPDAVEFDKEVSDEIDTLMSAFESSGLSLVAALNKAVHYALGSVAVKKEVDDDDDGDKAEKLRAKRKLAAQKKALKAVGKTPTDLDGVGRNSDKAGRDDGLPDPLKMTQAQFDKLTEKQKAELRDDTMKPH